jgi:hypothetical protein
MTSVALARAGSQVGSGNRAVRGRLAAPGQLRRTVHEAGHWISGSVDPEFTCSGCSGRTPLGSVIVRDDLSPQCPECGAEGWDTVVPMWRG